MLFFPNYTKLLLLNKMHKFRKFHPQLSQKLTHEVYVLLLILEKLVPKITWMQIFNEKSMWDQNCIVCP